MQLSLTRIAATMLATTMLVGAAQAETVRWARASDSLTLDPHSQNQGVTHTLAHHIYETLMNRDIEGTLQPRLATDWFVKKAILPFGFSSCVKASSSMMVQILLQRTLCSRLTAPALMDPI